MRSFFDSLDHEKIDDEVDPYLQIPHFLNKRKDPVLFTNVRNSSFKAIGNLCNRRDFFAKALDINAESLLPTIDSAISNPTEPTVTKEASSQQNIIENPDLSKLPIPTFTSRDLGPYITSGVFVSKDPNSEFGQNGSFHRACPISKDELVVRVCERDLHFFLSRTDDPLPVSICIGLHPSILLACAVSKDRKTDEFHIANSLKDLCLTEGVSNDLLIPASCEFVLEGIFTGKKAKEGPFLDITNTFDRVREQPVFKVKKITHRNDPLYHVLLPASNEHRLLMGMPKEPQIYNHLNQFVDCKNVHLPVGGCSWLHAIIQIRKSSENDSSLALREAFNSHGSLKHAIVVDEDIDPFNLQEVQWALATRFQSDSDSMVFKERGSSLDLSSYENRVTSKAGLDATKPMNSTKFDKGVIGR